MATLGAGRALARLASRSPQHTHGAITTARSLGTAANMTAEQMEQKYLLGNYSADGVRMTAGMVIERGKGSKLYDTHGKEYLDFFGGIAVNALGHSDEKLAAVIAAQALKIQHVSNILHTKEPLELAQLMVEHSKHFSKVFFANSGTEANEGALKLAKKYHLHHAMRKVSGQDKPPAYTAFGCKGTPPSSCYTQGGVCGCWPQSNNNDIAMHLKPDVIAFKGSFHGRTMGALAATHKPAIRMPFAPFPADVRFARFNNMHDVLKVWTPKTGVVIIEPVQGEGGINPGDPVFLRDLRQLCTERGALLIVDEVQCGLGRTGRLWAHEAYEGFEPDMMTLAKPLAGGLPIGAIMMTDAVASTISPGDHGTTYGGNPFVCAAASHVFKRIAEPSFLAHVQARGKQLLEGCKALHKKHPHIISAVRGTVDGGLFVGVDCIPPFKAIQQAAVAHGLLLISAGENTIRLAPPLIVTEAEVSHGLAVMDKAMSEAYPSPFKYGAPQ